jgi:hypothetical protein
MGIKRRKISEARQAKLDRLHARDCPGARSIEFECPTCREIRAREVREGKVSNV